MMVLLALSTAGRIAAAVVVIAAVVIFFIGAWMDDHR